MCGFKCVSNYVFKQNTANNACKIKTIMWWWYIVGSWGGGGDGGGVAVVVVYCCYSRNKQTM